METAPNQPSSKRELHWAKSPPERTRQFIVAKFYPRLLFTFSDVVIFVHRNPRYLPPSLATTPNYTYAILRTIESVLEKLIEWATDALEASYNHPILPYAIIVLNSSPATIQQGLWDVDIATEALLDSLSKALNQNIVFAQYAKFWKARGKVIETVEDLMLCYYSSVRVCGCSSISLSDQYELTKVHFPGCLPPSRHTAQVSPRPSSEASRRNHIWM